jgi:hypothetical protein
MDSSIFDLITAIGLGSGVSVGLGIALALLVQFVHSVSNNMAIASANTANSASLATQAGSADATKVATQPISQPAPK